MTRILALLLIAIGFIQASAIKQIKSYPSDDNLEVLLMLDSVFGGEIGTTTIQKQKMTMISDVKMSKTWSESFKTTPIKKLEIIPRNGNIYINVESRKNYYIKPSISKDKNTIKLSFFASNSKLMDTMLQTPTTIKPTPINQVLYQDSTPSQANSAQSSPESTPLKQDSASQFSSDIFKGKNYEYYILAFVGILIVLLLVRYQIKKTTKLNNALKIVSQSQIDTKNKVIILETKEYFYMILIGDKNNILLDKIPRTSAESKAMESKASPSTKQTTTKLANEKTFGDEFWNSLKNDVAKK